MIDLAYTDYSTTYKGVLSEKEYNNCYPIVWGIADSVCNGALFNKDNSDLSENDSKELMTALSNLLNECKEYVSDDGVLQSGLMTSETVGPWSQQFSVSSKYDNVYSLLYAKAKLLLSRVTLYRNRCAWV